MRVVVVKGDLIIITLWKDPSASPQTVGEVRRRIMILLDMYPDMLHIGVDIAGVPVLSIRRSPAVSSGFVANQVMSMVR